MQEVMKRLFPTRHISGHGLHRFVRWWWLKAVGKGGLVPMACSTALLLASLTASQPAIGQEESSWRDTIANWFSSSSTGGGDSSRIDATPSHVFQRVQDLIAEINILRDELGVYDYPPEAELQDERAPVHVYVKTLEVQTKVNAVQRRFGVPTVPVGQVPFKEVKPGDVLANVELILDEVRKIKVQMVIEREIVPTSFVGGKTPSLVYKSLADASFLLDGLRGRPLTPDDVFRNASFILDEMELIAAKLRVPLDLEMPEVNGAKRPIDVAQQVLRATYKVIGLQTRLGMDASGVPSLTLVRVTPSEVYDATNMLLAEMARIKLHLDINVPRDEAPEPRGMKPADVFATVLVIVRNLDLMTQAAVS